MRPARICVSAGILNSLPPIDSRHIDKSSVRELSLVRNTPRADIEAILIFASFTVITISFNSFPPSEVEMRTTAIYSPG